MEKKLITDMMISGEHENALEKLNILVNELPDSIDLQILLARCNLALGNIQDTEKIYQNLSKSKDAALITAKSEANLFLGKYVQALAELESGLAGGSPDAEELFLIALMAYKCGNIVKTIDFMKLAVENDLEWEDELPVNILVVHVLTKTEYHDFENIYLDVCEEIDEGHEQTNNRWFALNMPVYDFYTSTDDEKTKSEKILHQIYPGAPEKYLTDNNKKLEIILSDLAASQTDARFGLEAKRLLTENNIKELSELVLAMLLEHLSQFSVFLGIDAEFIKKSQLQDLVRILPYRLAVIAMVLFTNSHPIETTKNKEKLPVISTDLIAACLTGFYLEIEKFKTMAPTK